MRPELYSGENLEERCGRLVYTLKSEPKPNFFVLTDAPYDGSTGIQLALSSSDETIVLSETNFEYDWSTVLEAQLEEYSDLITYIYPLDLTFRVTDYCLGWTMSNVEIILQDEEGVV